MKGRVTARRLEPYSLAVPGLRQGRSERVRLIGDTRAGPTTRQLGDDSDLLYRLEHLVAPAGVKFVHVVRNPFDPISAMVRRGRRTFANAIQDHEAQCRRLVALREFLPSEQVFTVRYEEFTSDPVIGLDKVCEFLGLPTDSTYLDTCAGIVESNRPGERTTVDWTVESILAVEQTIGSVSFLQGYRWD